MTSRNFIFQSIPRQNPGCATVNESRRCGPKCYKECGSKTPVNRHGRHPTISCGYPAIYDVTASWFGGSAVNGTAEAIYDSSLGLLWIIGPIGFGLCLVLNGLFFVKKMREGNYVTLLDPIQAKLGKYIGLVFFATDALGEILYIASILTAIGGTLEVVAGIPQVPSVIVSASISAAYTVVGGMYSVAYTDVLQLCFMIFGLVIPIPFALKNEAVSSITESAYWDQGWLGTWNPDSAGEYFDTWLLVIFGGIPLQAIQQRVLSMNTTKHAKIICIGAGLACILLVIPPLLLGAAGASTNWTLTEYMNGSGISPSDLGDEISILPLVLQYLTPPVIAFFGLGAVTAAAMSSIDAEFLAQGSMFGMNVYKKILRQKASDREVVWVIRLTILVAAIASSAVSLTVNSITALYLLCVDFTYVLTFPHFVSVLYLDPNAYGSIPALIVGFVLRIGGGEALLNWPPPFSYIGGTNFPYKTVAMLVTFCTLNAVSYIARILFEGGYILEKYDVLHSNLANGGRSRFLIKNDNFKRTESELRTFSEDKVTTA